MELLESMEWTLGLSVPRLGLAPFESGDELNLAAPKSGLNHFNFRDRQISHMWWMTETDSNQKNIVLYNVVPKKTSYLLALTSMIN